MDQASKAPIDLKIIASPFFHPFVRLPRRQLQKPLGASAMKLKKPKIQIAGSYVSLAGSHKAAPQATAIDTLNSNEVMSVTVRVRRKRSLDPVLKNAQRLSHADYEKNYGAKASDLAAVEDFSKLHHLSVVESSPARRSVVLIGTVKNFEEAFQVHLSHFRAADGTVFRGRSGGIKIPSGLVDLVEGVFGLDNRPHATPHFQAKPSDGTFAPHPAPAGSFTANQIAKIYGFPNGTGLGQCIGIIELGGGFRNADLHTYFTGLGITTPSVMAKSVDGGLNSPTNANSADGEVMLDIEVAGSVATQAKQVVYFTPNTDQGFLDAITTAIHDTVNNPSVISISWGSAESQWTVQSMNSFNEAFRSAAALGVTICVAAGDSGSSDSVLDGKVHVDFPASSPYVLACGGTRLVAKGNTVAAETVWHDSNTSATGGGVSEFFPLPSYQVNKGVPVSVSTKFKGRGVPDVAGDADPVSGYRVVVDGQSLVFGGTSAVAPLMAGLIAVRNQLAGTRAGFINPKLYATPTQFCRDITVGDNVTTTTLLGYHAGPGWDACTGWGVMNKI
jgi:kumamolisin